MANLSQCVGIRSRLADGLILYLERIEESLVRLQQERELPPEAARLLRQVVTDARDSRRRLEARTISVDGLRNVPILVDLTELARVESTQPGHLRLSEHLGRTAPAGVLGWISSLLLSDRCQIVAVRGQGLLHGTERSSLERFASELADQGCRASVVAVDAEFGVMEQPATGIETLRRAIAIWFRQFEAPDPPALFLGRDRELRHLFQGFGARRLQVITGDRGVGKTALALAYAHAHRGRYDAVFWIDWSKRERDFARLLRRYRIPARSTDVARTGARLSASEHGPGSIALDVEPAALAVQQWLEDVTAASLLVIDDVQEWAEAERWLDPSYRGHVILTGRQPPLTTAQRMSELRLRAWDPDTSASLLMRAGAAAGAGQDEERAARRIHDEAGGIPAAIVRVVDYIVPRLFTCRTFLELPKEDRDAVYRHPGSVHDWLSSMGSIREAAAREPRYLAAANLSSVLTCLDLDHVELALLVETVVAARPSAGALTYTSEILTKEALFLLQAHSLVEVANDRSGVRMLPAVRDALFQTLSRDEQRAAARIAAAALGSRIDRISPTALAALDAADRVRWAEERIAALDRETAILSTSWANFEQRIPHADRLYDLARDLLGACRRDVGFPADADSVAGGPASRPVAAFLARTAFLLTNLKRGAQAQMLFEAAREILERLEDPAALADALAREGDNLDLLGRRSEARELFRRALELRKPIFGVRDPDAAHISNALGLSFLESGEYAIAEPHLQQALAIGTACGDRSLTGAAYYNLATLHERLANPDACELYARALESLEETGIRWMVAQARRALDRCRERRRR